MGCVVGMKVWGSAPSACWSKNQAGSLATGKLRQARNTQEGGGKADRSDSLLQGMGRHACTMVHMWESGDKLQCRFLSSM